MTHTTDRELLELAAKAGGYVPVRWTDDETALLLKGVQEPWNPLTDDGDALRLAVKLGILFLIDVHCGKCVKKTVVTDGKTKHEVKHDGDPYAATRRAIVLAAAEIGRAADTGGCGMTPEELQEALKPHRMTKCLADVSGYGADYLTLLKQGKHKMRERTAKNLAEALPRAQQLWQAQYHALYYRGKPCVTCGSTMRYTTTKKCVPCNHRIRSAYAAARRAAK